MAQAEDQGLLQQRNGLKSGLNVQVVLSCLLAFQSSLNLLAAPELERDTGTGSRCSLQEGGMVPQEYSGKER